MIKYPKYTRDESGRCKITEKDVLYIRHRYELHGETANALSKQFGVSWGAIKNVVDEEYHQYRLAKYRARNQRNSKEYQRLANKKCYQRMIKMKTGLSEWKRDQNKMYREKEKA